MTSRTGATALLLLDFQVGLGDMPFAAQAVERAARALDAGRKVGLLRVFSKLAFQEGHADVAPWSPFFSAAAAKSSLAEENSRVVPGVAPTVGEAVINKRRFSAFSGSELHVVLRSQGVTDLVMCGVSTGGVILSTFAAASDEDYSLTVLSDACADPNASLHQELMAGLFPRSARVTTVGEWIASMEPPGPQR